MDPFLHSSRYNLARSRSQKLMKNEFPKRRKTKMKISKLAPLLALTISIGCGGSKDSAPAAPQSATPQIDLTKYKELQEEYKKLQEIQNDSSNKVATLKNLMSAEIQCAQGLAVSVKEFDEAIVEADQ